MREPLAGLTVRLDAKPTPSSTTIAAVGGSVLVIATAAPALPLTVTSCFLARSDNALAVMHLRLTTDEEDFQQYVTAPAEAHHTLAGACLLEHAAAVRDALAEISLADVSVDVDPDALRRASDVWGPGTPPG